MRASRLQARVPTLTSLNAVPETNPQIGSPLEGRACRVRPSEGPACQVRRRTFDYPFRFDGHDKHAPPKLPSEGPACRVRRTTIDNPFRLAGHDECARPMCSRCLT